MTERLKEKYGIRIPVVALPNGDEKGWPFTAAQIGRMLQVSEQLIQLR